jgi:hypothetical protein
MYNIVSLPNEQTLIGSVNHSPPDGTHTIVRSIDGGKTWSSLPHSNKQISFSYGTPDGTLYGVHPSGSTDPDSICKLTSGATEWDCQISYNTEFSSMQQLSAVSWDDKGHPRFIWSITIKDYANTGSSFPVLEYRSA